MCNKNLHNSYPIVFWASLQPGKRVNRGNECRLEIFANFHFYGPEKDIKPAKIQHNKDRRKVKRKCKTLPKVQRI